MSTNPWVPTYDALYQRADGKKIKVTEWRKYTKGRETVVIRTGELRIGGSPRQQMAVYLGANRVLPLDETAYYNFNTVVDEANDWIREFNKGVKMAVFAKPIDEEDDDRVKVRLLPKPRNSDPRHGVSKAEYEAKRKADIETVSNLYHKTDFTFIALEDFMEMVADELDITLYGENGKVILWRMLREAGLSVRDAKVAARKKHRAELSRRIRALILANPRMSFDNKIGELITANGYRTPELYTGQKHMYYKIRKKLKDKGLIPESRVYVRKDTGDVRTGSQSAPTNEGGQYV